MKKVIWAVLALFVLVNGALLLTLTPEVLPTPAPPQLAFPAAQPPADMRIAAIKAGKMTSLEAFSYRGGSLLEQRDSGMGGILIRHPQGLLLVDTGFGADLDQHVKTVPPLMRATTKITREPTVAEQLRAAGIEPSQLKAVILTHAHWDHVSGLPDLGPVPVWLPEAEIDFIKAGTRATALLGTFPDVKYQTYRFEGGPYLGFGRSYDVFGDGSVVIVPAPGHTPGTIVVFVRTPDGKHYALVGDIVWTREGIELPAERPWLPRRMVDHDAAANRDVIVKLHGIHQALPELVFVPAHDRGVWESLPKL